MTLIVANLNFNNSGTASMWANTTSEDFIFKIDAKTHVINQSYIEVDTTVVNAYGNFNQGVLTSGISEYVFLPSNLTPPANYILTDTAYNKASYPDLVSILQSKPDYPYIGTWTNRSVANNENAYAPVYGNGVYVVAGGTTGNILRSTDTITWTVQTSSSAQKISAAWGNGIFVAAGTYGNGSGGISSSTDGITWTTRTPANNNAQRATAYGNGLFVVVGNAGAIQTSPDGAIWTNQTSAKTTDQYAVTYGNGVYVSAGTSGSIQSSTDGVTWVSRTAANTFGINALTYGNGIFVSVGGNGAIQTSTDGTTWTNRPNPAANTLNGVAYGGGIYIAATAGNKFVVSTDGITWRVKSSANTETVVESLGYGNGIFILACRDNTLGGTVQTLTLDFDVSTQFKVPAMSAGNLLTAYVRAY